MSNLWSRVWFHSPMEYAPSYTHNQKRALGVVKLFIEKKEKKKKGAYKPGAFKFYGLLEKA